MTTIAWDGRLLAADGLRCAGHEPVEWSAKKIRVVGSMVYAITGAWAMFDAVIDWYVAGADPANAPKVSDDDTWTLVVLTPAGITTFCSKRPYPEMWPAPQAWGSGSEYALGAMHAGRNAYQAVEIASRLNLHTGGTITCVDTQEVFQKVAAE